MGYQRIQFFNCRLFITQVMVFPPIRHCLNFTMVTCLAEFEVNQRVVADVLVVNIGFLI